MLYVFIILHMPWKLCTRRFTACLQKLTDFEINGPTPKYLSSDFRIINTDDVLDVTW